MAEVPLDWSAKIAFCRAQGVVSAEWSESTGKLLSCSLGPVAPTPRDPADKPAPKVVNRTEDILRGGSQLKPRARE